MRELRSSDARDELARVAVTTPHCRAALPDGLVTYGAVRGRAGTFRTRHEMVARLFRSLLPDRKERPVAREMTRRSWRREAYPMYSIDARVVDMRPQPAACDRRMYLYAAVLAGAEISRERTYDLEFDPPNTAAPSRLIDVLTAEGFPGDTVLSGASKKSVCKGLDAIARVFEAIDASHARVELAGVRALEEAKHRIDLVGKNVKPTQTSEDFKPADWHL